MQYSRFLIQIDGIAGIRKKRKAYFFLIQNIVYPFSVPKSIPYCKKTTIFLHILYDSSFGRQNSRRFTLEIPEKPGEYSMADITASIMGESCGIIIPRLQELVSFPEVFLNPGCRQIPEEKEKIK